MEERDQNNSFCRDAAARMYDGWREISGHGKDQELDAQGPSACSHIPDGPCGDCSQHKELIQ